MANDEDRSVRDNRHKAGSRPFLTPPGFGREQGAPGKKVDAAIERQNQIRMAKEQAAGKEPQKPAAIRTSDEAVNRRAEQQGYRLIDDPVKKDLDSPEQMREQAGLDGRSGQERTVRRERKQERSSVMRPNTERRPHFRGRDQGDQGRGR